MLLGVVLLQSSQPEDYGWCACVCTRTSVCVFIYSILLIYHTISHNGIILFHWCYDSSTGLGIHDLINSPNIKALVSSTDDATLEYLKCIQGLSYVLGYFIIYGCHLLPESAPT